MTLRTIRKTFAEDEMKKLIIIIIAGFTTGCGTGYAVVKTHKGGGYSEGLNMETVEGSQNITFLKSNDTNIAICMAPNKNTEDNAKPQCYNLAQPIID